MIEREWKIFKTLHPNRDVTGMTTTPNENTLLYWLSNTYHSVEPITPDYQRLSYLLEAHPSLYKEGLAYFEQQFYRVYPQLSFEKYKDAIAIILSHCIFDYLLITSQTRSLRVLDYCGGFGRNVSMFRQNPNQRYISAEALPTSVHSFKTFHQGHFSELTATNEIDTFFSPTTEKNIGFIHLDHFHLLPDRSINSVIYSWVFYEMDEPSAREAIDNIQRVLAEDGAILFKDIPNDYCHTIDFAVEMDRLGFAPSYSCRDERSFGITTVFHRKSYLENSQFRQKGWSPYIR